MRETLIQPSLEKRELAGLATILLSSLIVRILLFPLPGYKVDLQDFGSWINTAATYGPRLFYQNAGFCDYSPFNIYIFWVSGTLAKQFSVYGTIPLNFVIKLSPNLFDLATVSLIYGFVRKRLSFEASLTAAGLYAFNPAVIFNTAVWGQYDSIYTFLLVLSLMLVFASKPELSAAAFAIGLLTKPQSIALAPLMAYLILSKFGWRRLIVSLLAVAVTVFLVIIPFQWNNPIMQLSSIYFGAYGGYAYTSMFAFNIWAFGGFWVPDTNFFLMGWLLFGAATIFVLYALHKRLQSSGDLLAVSSAFVLFFGFFMLPTRIHERYLFPALSVLALMFVFLRKTRPVYVVLTATCLVNQAYVLYFLNAGQFIPSGDPVAIAVSLINSVAFLYVLMLMWGELRGRSWLSSDHVVTSTDALLEG